MPPPVAALKRQGFPVVAAKYPPLASCAAAETPTKPHAWSRRRLITGSKNSTPLLSNVLLPTSSAGTPTFTVDLPRPPAPWLLSSIDTLADRPAPNCHV